MKLVRAVAPRCPMPYNHLALGQAGSKTPAAQHLRDVAQFGSAPALGAGCRRFESCRPDHTCGRSSMVEPQPSKLMTRVRFPSPAPERYGARRPRGAGLFACARREANPARGAELSKCAEHLSAKPARAARLARSGCGYADSRRPLQNVAEPCPRGAGLLACRAVHWLRFRGADIAAVRFRNTAMPSLCAKGISMAPRCSENAQHRVVGCSDSAQSG